MNKLSIIIPSRRATNLWESAGQVRWNDPQKTIVVDDGVNQSELDLIRTSFARRGFPFRSIGGLKPFCFSRNINLGIKAAGSDDVVILNDDAILETSCGFQALQAAWQANPEFGLVSAATNNTGNINQAVQDLDPRAFFIREDPRMVCFVAVFIPRSTIDKVGLLDESFTGYGYEDDDYCLRVRQAGLKIGIYDGCVVDHTQLNPTFRPRWNRSAPPDLIEINRKIFIAKHGADRMEV